MCIRIDACISENLFIVTRPCSNAALFFSSRQIECQ